MLFFNTSSSAVLILTQPDDWSTARMVNAHGVGVLPWSSTALSVYECPYPHPECTQSVRLRRIWQGHCIADRATWNGQTLQEEHDQGGWGNVACCG